jgi:hypothetical protein
MKIEGEALYFTTKDTKVGVGVSLGDLGDLGVLGGSVIGACGAPGSMRR